MPKILLLVNQIEAIQSSRQIILVSYRDHPECPQRIDVIYSKLEESGLVRQCYHVSVSYQCIYVIPEFHYILHCL